MVPSLRARTAVLIVAVAVVGAAFLAVSRDSSTPSPVADQRPSAAPPSANQRPSADPSAAIPAASDPGASLEPSGAPEAWEDLSGIPTTTALAHRYPIAVMLDDSPAARPQAGLADASVVYQAPAEGNIPRYMALFQAGAPKRIGPIRSARLYFVRWASETKAVYAHIGGPPPLRAYLDAGKGGVVNADAFRWQTVAFQRVTWRATPHNEYATEPKLRVLARRLNATDDRLGYDSDDLWSFREGAALEDRGPDGGTIRVGYRGERIDYRYDRATNTWLRSVDGREHRDPGATENAGYGAATDGVRIAPATVVVMLVPIRRSSSIDGPALGRLEADTVGSNTAWIFADGRLITGTWRKASESARTRFHDRAGREIVLPRGQVFLQVISRTGQMSATVESAS